jgi:transcriptional regulator with XRE-family HTH domain
MSQDTMENAKKNTLDGLLASDKTLAKRVADRAGLAELASVLIKLRHELGWTQKELAERSHLPKSMISELENAANDGVTLRTLVRIARGAGAAISLGLELDERKAGSVATWLQTPRYDFHAQLKGEQPNFRTELKSEQTPQKTDLAA